MTLKKIFVVGLTCCIIGNAVSVNEVNCYAENNTKIEETYNSEQEASSTDAEVIKEENNNGEKVVEEDNNDEVIIEDDYIVDQNDFYNEDIENEYQISQINARYNSLEDEKKNVIDAEKLVTFNTVEEAGIYYRDNLVKRKEHISFVLKESKVEDLYDYHVTQYAKMKDIAFEETDKPYEGDYLYWNWRNTWHKVIQIEGGVVFDFECFYQSTYEEELYVNKVVNNLLEEEFEGWQKRSDYENVKDIYDWITYTYKYVASSKSHSSYSGFVNHETVCQGYSTSFYRLAREMGISTRVIASEVHGWNIVKLGDKYYNLDTTWDAEKRADEWENFLKCEANFDPEGSHVRKSRYKTAAFNKKYPMSNKDYAVNKNDYGFEIMCISHIQSYGWTSAVGENSIVGTVGESKRLEAVKFYIKKNSRYDLGIEYMGHTQSYGWNRDWLGENKLCGSERKSKRLEAIGLRLTGADSSKYDLYYQAHVQSYGWLGWAKNGEYVGSEGMAKRMEAIRFVVLPKGEKPEGLIGYSFIQNGKRSNSDDTSLGNVYYKTHIQSYDWQKYVHDGSISGTFDEAKRMEAISIGINTNEKDSGITYKSHIQGIGWENKWHDDGEISGTTGKGKRLEAIRISLYGSIEKNYDIYYRVHAQTYGWMGWAKNGEPAGTEGMAKRLEAIQIVILPKGMTPSEGMNKMAFIK